MLTACSTAEPPTVSPADIATIVVATQRAAPTITPSPFLSPTPTITPTPTSTPVPGTPAAPTRIALPKGARSDVIEAHIGAGETRGYVVRGVQAQQMLVDLSSEAGDATLFMMSQGGTYFVRPGTTDTWRGALPQTGEYYLGVYGGSTPTDYTLSVQMVSRIRFKEGKTSAVLSGQAPDGAVTAFSLFGIEGQKLSVTLSGAGSKASLGVYGFRNDTPYLLASTQKHEFVLIAPVTQDYIIEIVPIPGATVNYILDISVESPP